METQWSRITKVNRSFCYSGREFVTSPRRVVLWKTEGSTEQTSDVKKWGAVQKERGKGEERGRNSIWSQSRRAWKQTAGKRNHTKMWSESVLPEKERIHSAYDTQIPPLLLSKNSECFIWPLLFLKFSKTSFYFRKAQVEKCNSPLI